MCVQKSKARFNDLDLLAQMADLANGQTQYGFKKNMSIDQPAKSKSWSMLARARRSNSSSGSGDVKASRELKSSDFLSHDDNNPMKVSLTSFSNPVVRMTSARRGSGGSETFDVELPA